MLVISNPQQNSFPQTIRMKREYTIALNMQYLFWPCFKQDKVAQSDKTRVNGPNSGFLFFFHLTTANEGTEKWLTRLLINYKLPPREGWQLVEHKFLR